MKILDWTILLIVLEVSALVFRIVVQVRIKVQVGKISKIGKHAGWNKVEKVGLLGILPL